MTNLKSSAELKAIAKERSLEKYGTLISADLIVIIIQLVLSGIATVSSSGSIIQYVINEAIVLIVSILLGVLVSGKTYLYMNLIYSQNVSISDLFFGFKIFPEKAVKVQSLFVLVDFVIGLPATYLLYLTQHNTSPNLLLGTILALFVELIVNIYVRLTYSQAFYLLHDFQDRSAKELLSTSRRLMKGNRFKLLYLNVSFIPIMLLGVITLFIPLLWINVYRNATLAAFYQDLIMQYAHNNTVEH